MKFNKETFEIIFFARAGQGAKAAAEIIAQAALFDGRFVQAFPSFGPERSGAPMKTFVRISDKEIRTHEPITDPDVIVVLDDTLLGIADLVEVLNKNEILLVNTARDIDFVRRKLKHFEGKIYTIDANKISMQEIGQPRPNTVVLGKLVQISGVVSIDSVKKELRKIFELKIGKETTNKNIRALEVAYDSI